MKKGIEDKIITLKHSLRILNKLDIIRICANNGVVIEHKNKIKDIKEKLIHIIRQGNETLYTELRDAAFNPNLDVLDGFFIVFDTPRYNMISKEDIKNSIEEFNKNNMENKENEENEEIGFIENVEIVNEYIKFMVMKIKHQYVYDAKSKKSKSYESEIKANVEIDLEKRFIYIQTKNVNIYKGLKTVIREFLMYHFYDNKLKLGKPELYQNLSIDFIDINSIDKLNKVNPVTLKLLDIVYELENMKYAFSGFRVNDILFDHEERNSIDLSSRIDSINIYGENLLEHSQIKEKILQGRIILYINFILEYNTISENGNNIKHYVEAGIDYKGDYARIFIKNNKDLERIILIKAYNELKRVFMENYLNGNLKNELKILNLLGVNKNEEYKVSS
ncbi:hypothetical protein [Tepidibacter mesophilus]|uniref:hypothetical protein n=1 Tax=Tepidibacter mesophilus TaxID=655607 RepID=UPI000C07E6F6|nr:hypothetical protein [Tepidibacter mesophilus]